ncbi:MAG: N-6 DNA methylase [candidate division WOR-3 bacterium]
MGEKEILKKIIEDFDLEKFETFFRRKNDRLRFDRETLSNYGNQNFTDGLKFAEGELDDGEFIVCAYKIQKNLSERSSKKEQYEIGKKILKNYQKDAGIFIFYDKEKNFRFSLIYPIYYGRKRDWSNFKRFTYFVSKQETNKTFLTQIGEGDFSSIEKIKYAFSVEKVTKEFYQEIAYWYFWALKESKFPEDAEIEKNGRNIALIRLITRLIFIWFMRQKGIIKRELFDKKFLETILKDFSPEESTFYPAILQNLFFATLNTPVEDRKFRREERHKGYLNKDYMNHSYYRHHSLFKDSDKMIELFNDIPFLNGGLFECLDKRKDDESNDTGKEIRIDGFSDNPKKQPIVPNFLFFSDEKEVDLNKDFGTKDKRYKVRGIINILNSYNFTIDENTPIDEEVALDPELLGRVFENLLASYNPETSTTARKATGSYYTPREIVDFMVKESLKEYFKTKIENIDEEKLEKVFQYDDSENPFDEKTTKELINAINNLKLLDPAVGSGAFPMGALHQLVNILHKLDPHNKRWKEEQIKAVDYITDPKIKQEMINKIEENFSLNELDYGRKLYLIQNCIYGVDIQPIAIQIAKLRCFISLLVDENVDKNKKNFGIEPLPNLETKFVVTDSLKKLKVETVLRSNDIVQTEIDLTEIRNRYFISSDIREKNKLKKKDSELRKKLAENFLKFGNLSKTDSEKIASWNPYNTDKPADWFDPEFMFGIRDGFDIVIGNPPYIQLQKDSGKLAEEYQSYKYETFARTGDIYTLFYERGIDLLQDNGLLCYITSNKWMRSGYGEKLRCYFTQYNPLLLIDLGPGVFEHATVDTNILLLQKKESKRYDYKLKGLILQKTDKLSIEQQIKENSTKIKKLTKEAWFIGSSAEQKLKEKIEHIGKPLKLWDVKIYYGIKTGLNEAFIITTEKREEILANCKDKEERKRTEAIIKPILRGRDISRYYYEWAGLWVIGTFPALNLNIEEYPALKKYFLDNFDIRRLEQSGKKYPHLGIDARKKTDNKWFETQDQIAYYPEFEKEKVVWTAVNSKYSFTILPPGFYFNNSIFMITGCNAKLWCAIFNSKLIRKYMQFLFASEENYTYASKENVEKIPIPIITNENESIVKQIENLVDKILIAKKQCPQSDIKSDIKNWEQEIDQLVYKLYKLNKEEICLVN